MNNEEWDFYVNTGFVPQHFLKSMVESIKLGHKLNQQHFAVYQSHGPIIEMMLSKK